MFYVTTIIFCYTITACGKQIVNCSLTNDCNDYNKAKNNSACYVERLFYREDASGKFFSHKFKK